MQLTAFVNPQATPATGEQTQNLWDKLKVGLSFPLASQATAPQDNSVPVAYLKYIFYDQNYNPTRDLIVPVTSAALAANGGWEGLSFDITASEEGYVQVLVANESDKAVWFDDLQIRHTPALIVQENHYDPWGLNLAGIEKQGQPDHKFQYLNREKQSELGLNWLDLKARMYDPQLGRWHAVDPMAEVYHDYSPYNYAINNPATLFDPNGMWVATANGWSTNNSEEIGQFLQAQRSLAANGGGFETFAGNGADNEAFRIVSIDGKRSEAHVFYGLEEGNRSKKTYLAPDDGFSVSKNYKSKADHQRDALGDIYGLGSDLIGFAAGGYDYVGAGRDRLINSGQWMGKNGVLYDVPKRAPNGRMIGGYNGKGLSGTFKAYSNATKAIKVAGVSLAAVSGLMAVGEFYYSDRKAGDYTKLIVGAIITGTGFIPGVGIPIAIGLSALEYAYGDHLYNYVNE